jgi:hypothetical protein
MKKALVIIVGPALLLVVLVVVFAHEDPLSNSKRRAWKEVSLANISGLVAQTGWPASELALLKKPNSGAPDNSDYESWLSERLILMGNGEWLAYANTCQKEDSAIYDFFLARGSDRRWYYSTFHFCKGMVVLKAEEQPKSLAEFAKAYRLRSFDGHSDECLQKTWPP